MSIKNPLWLLACCSTLLLPQSVGAQAEEGQPQNLPISARVKVAGQSFALEVARTPQQEAIGLMFRTRLEPARGMLFLFDPPRPTRFWMFNTLIPLDMVFAYKGKIVDIQQDVPPCKTPQCPTYGPTSFDTLVDQVFEFDAGTARKLKLKPGDGLKVEFLRGSARHSGQ